MKQRYRLLLEQAVAMSPKALVEGSTASPTQLQATVEVPAVAPVKQEVERVQDGGTEADDGILEDDVSVEHVVEEEQTEGDASGQDSGTEVWDGVTEGDGEYEDGDATGVHEDEDVPEQDRGSEGDVSEEQQEAVLVVGVENNSSRLSIV